MIYNLKNINNITTNMHYLEVIDWIKDNSKDWSDQLTYTSQFFDTKSEEDDELNEIVKQKVKKFIEFNEK